MKIFAFFLLSFMLLACNNGADTNHTNDTTAQQDTNNGNYTPDIPVIDNVSGCYMGVTGRDTLVASLTRNGDKVTGKLTFDNYQKDGSSGTVSGMVEGGIIKLNYDFFSEGMQSVMDVYFKFNDSSIVRGIGEMDVKGDTAYYVNPDAVVFNGSELLRLDCSQLPGKYR